MTGRRLLILACSATKRPDPGLMPALERYDGPAYRTVRAFARSGGVLPPIRILSARHGLIHGAGMIADYEQRMTYDRASELGSSARDEELFGQAVAGAGDVFVFCGHLYGAVFAQWRARRGPVAAAWHEPAGGIGVKLGALKRWLAS